jgi:hypothetical protein
MSEATKDRAVPCFFLASELKGRCGKRSLPQRQSGIASSGVQSPLAVNGGTSYKVQLICTRFWC